ncbi:MAG: HAD family hydrolase [Acidobacteriota bacterium]|jgi:putative hydrolase of the HAD superfamily
MANLTTILFDIYGTLIDIHTNEQRDDIFETLSRFLGYRRLVISPTALKELYFSELHQQFARSRERFPEVDVARAFERALSDQSRNADRFLTVLVTQLYRSLSRERFGLFPDTFWTLTEFRKRYRLGIVTDAQRLFSCPELRMLRIEDFFDSIVISSDYGFRKPDPRLFHIALAAMDARPEESAYIGNKYETDLLGAHSAGLRLAGLIHQSEEDRKALGPEPQPDFVVENLRAAYDFITAKD